MKFTVKITPEANLEESEAYSYYETIRPGLGDEFLDTLLAHYDKLQQNPFYYSFITRSNLLRDVAIDRFPYLIVYFVREHEVIVISVRNTHKRPVI